MYFSQTTVNQNFVEYSMQNCVLMSILRFQVQALFRHQNSFCMCIMIQSLISQSCLLHCIYLMVFTSWAVIQDIFFSFTSVILGLGYHTLLILWAEDRTSNFLFLHRIHHNCIRCSETLKNLPLWQPLGGIGFITAILLLRS